MKKIQLIATLFLCISIGGFAAVKAKKQAISIVFVGNSITQGALLTHVTQDAPPAKTAAYLHTQSGIISVQSANCGVSGATTVDFLPAAANLFPKVQVEANKLAADKSAQLLFSIKLGTNDSAEKGPTGAPVSAVQYQTNMKVIIDRLLTLYPTCLVVLHRPLWYSSNTYNGAIYLLAGLKRLDSYYPQLQTLVSDYATTHPKRVWLGDTDGYEYMKANYLTDLVPENGNAGIFYLHPNVKGADKLGELWGKAIYNVLFPSQL